MLSSGMKCYHLELMLSSGTKCYHLELMLSSRLMLSSVTKCYQLELMLSSISIVIIWCYHVMLSSGMITPPFFIFPGNFTHSITHRTFFKFYFKFAQRYIAKGDRRCMNPQIPHANCSKGFLKIFFYRS